MHSAEIAIADLVGRPSWMAAGACRDHPTGLFYPSSSASRADRRRNGTTAAEARAVAICRTCLVRVECAAYAIETNEVWGVWGGLTELQRHQLRKRGDLTA